MIDKAVSELKRRFSDENREIFLAVGALMPGTPKFLNVDLLMPGTTLQIERGRFQNGNSTAKAHDSTKDSRWNVAVLVPARHSGGPPFRGSGLGLGLG